MSPTGLLFAASNKDVVRGDLSALFLQHGYLGFARRCGMGRVYGRYSSVKLDDGKWHKVRIVTY